MSSPIVHGHAAPLSAPRDNKTFQRGLNRTPPHKLAAAVARGEIGVHEPKAAPAQFGIVPPKLSMWLNNQYGDCVTAEAMYFIACMTYLVLGAVKEVVVSDAAVLAFCRKFNLLNGADLLQVIQIMEKTGITDGSNAFKEGSTAVVDYTNPAAYCSAIAEGGVLKIAIDANALPSGAGNGNGWYAFGGRPGQFGNTDHCTALSGFGTASFCFGLLGVPVPSGVDPNKPDCRLHFTWDSIGVVDDAWTQSTCTEAHIRSSCIMNGTPLVVGPPVPPVPPIPPVPVPSLVTLQQAQQWAVSGIAHADAWFDFLTREHAEAAVVASLAANWPTAKELDGAIPWATVLMIVQWMLKLGGPLAVPIIEAWVAKQTWLTPAQKAAIDALIESILQRHNAGM